MSENEDKRDMKAEKAEEKEEKEKKEDKKSGKKSQAEILQETLGIQPEQMKTIERKLFAARFIDYFTEETLDFIYKDKNLNKYLERLDEIMNEIKDTREEDKLLAQSYENKNINESVRNLKEKADNFAGERGVTQAFDKKMRKWSLLITIPMIAVVLVFLFVPGLNQISTFVLFPLLCVFCLVPSLLRNYIVKKWQSFKEENKMPFYTENREDVLILKNFVSEILSNIRNQLVEMRVPLQLIKFVLHSRDYDGLKLLNQSSQRGTTQYYFSFEYPEGVEPFPIPEKLMENYEGELLSTEESFEKSEQNFIVLSDLKTEDDIIKEFVPTLKDEFSEEINELLNEAEFEETDKTIVDIIPNYGKDNPIYCVCGEIAEIENIRIVNWKDEFKFYLMVASQCDCGEKVYALSRMHDDDEVPDKFKKIFID
jgi:hypothetical protein